MEGEELRFLPLEIWVDAPRPSLVYTGLEPLPAGRATLDFVMEGGALRPVSQALPGGQQALAVRGAAMVGVGFLWWTLSLLGLLLLSKRPGRPGRSVP